VIRKSDLTRLSETVIGSLLADQFLSKKGIMRLKPRLRQMSKVKVNLVLPNLASFIHLPLGNFLN
jgi:hypothetical protein